MDFKKEKLIDYMKDMLELIEFRKIVDLGFLSLTIEKMDKNDLKKLNKYFEKHEKGVIENNFPSEVDKSFHKTTTMSTHNKII